MGQRGCCAFKQPFTEDAYKMEKSPFTGARLYGIIPLLI